MKGAFGFRKEERIIHPQDFRRVMRSGKKVTSKSFILFFQDNGKGFHRLGIVLRKEVGQATLRNRIRRYIREFFRLHKHLIRGSLDLVILVKKGPLPNRYREAEEELRRALT